MASPVGLHVAKSGSTNSTIKVKHMHTGFEEKHGYLFVGVHGIWGSGVWGSRDCTESNSDSNSSTTRGGALAAAFKLAGYGLPFPFFPIAKHVVE